MTGDALTVPAVVSDPNCAGACTALPVAPSNAPLEAATGISGQRSAGRFQMLVGMACLSLQPLLLNLISIPAIAYVIRCLGAAAYGQWVTAGALVATASIVTNLGLRTAFVRTVARRPGSAQDAFADQLGLRIALSFVAAGVALGASFALGYNQTVLQCALVGILSIFVTTVSTTATDLMQGLEGFRSIATANMVGGLLLTAASVVVARLRFGPVALTAAYLLGPAATAAVLIFFSMRRGVALRVRFGVRRGWQLAAQSRSFTVQQILMIVETNVALLMLPRLISAGAFGLYSAGALIADRLMYIPEAVGTVVYPRLSKYGSVAPQRLKKRILLLVCMALLGGTCIAVATFGFAPWIASILFPKTPIQCQAVIRITVWALPLASAHLVVGYILIGLGREGRVTRPTFICVIANLGLGTVLLLKGGYLGACAFAIVRQFVRLAVLLPEFARVLALPRHDESLRRDAGSQLTEASSDLFRATV